MKLYIASDHAGFKIKEKLKLYLLKKGYNALDLGTHSLKPVDYPDYAKKVAKKVSKEKDSKGILVCGTGSGMMIAANKVKGIRAVAAYDQYSARMSRLDNNTNILGLRGRNFSFEKIKTIVDTWLNTKFSDKSRHIRRIKKLEI